MDLRLIVTKLQIWIPVVTLYLKSFFVYDFLAWPSKGAKWAIGRHTLHFRNFLLLHARFLLKYCEFCTKNQRYQLIKWKLQHHFFSRDATQIIWTIEYFLALFWIKLCCQRVWIRIFWHPLRAILACLGIILNSITYPSLPRILWLPKLLLSNIISITIALNILQAWV